MADLQRRLTAVLKACQCPAELHVINVTSVLPNGSVPKLISEWPRYFQTAARAHIVTY